MAGTEAQVYVKGMRELSIAFAEAGKDAQKQLRRRFAEVGRPIADDAEQRALAEISHIGLSKRRKWWKMRVGVTRTLVYVAPQQRGRLSRRNPERYRRPKFADLLMGKAMEPALMHNIPHIERAVQAALDDVANHFNH